MSDAASAPAAAARLEGVVEASEAVASTRSRSAKVARLAGALKLLDPIEVALAVAYLSGDLPQGRIGVGYAAVFGTEAPAATTPELTLRELDERLGEIATQRGSGAGKRRTEALGALLARATEREQAFLKRLLVGELRQGALEGVMADAVASAFDVLAERVRRAAMLSGNLAQVAAALRAEGPNGLEKFHLALFRPLGPMLAQSATGTTEALSTLGTAIFDYKLDGARIQAHKSGDEVRLYTRSLKDVTSRAPELVQVVRELPVSTAILDGEVVSLRRDG